MASVIRIAWRNLAQHRSKTILVGILITLAIGLDVVGNSILASAQESLKKTFTDNFTGNVLICPQGIRGGIFGASNGGNGNGPPILPMMKDYEKVYATVKTQPGISSLTSQISAYVMFNLGGGGLNFGLAFGVDPQSYFKTFNNVDILQGHRLASGETGIMLHEKVIQTLEKENDVHLKVGDHVQLNNFGEAGFKIRDVPIVGIFRFKAGNERSFPFMQPNFVDVNTLRALQGKPILTPADLKFDTQQKAALDISDADFFSGSTVTGVGSTQTKTVSLSSLDNILGPKTAKADPASTQNGAWNYILLKLNPGVATAPFILHLNQIFQKEKLPVKAQDWVDSAQPDSGIFMAISFIFNIVIWVLSIVSIIIIMNTLIAAVMERTAEIGTMRALGAQKSFIRNLFILETVTVSVLAGALGLILGFFLLILLQVTGITAPNDFMKLIFGGAKLYPHLSGGPLLTALIMLAVISLVSWIFPVLMALKVSPLKAIQSD